MATESDADNTIRIYLNTTEFPALSWVHNVPSKIRSRVIVGLLSDCVRSGRAQQLLDLLGLNMGDLHEPVQGSAVKISPAIVSTRSAPKKIRVEPSMTPTPAAPPAAAAPAPSVAPADPRSGVAYSVEPLPSVESSDQIVSLVSITDTSKNLANGAAPPALSIPHTEVQSPLKGFFGDKS